MNKVEIKPLSVNKVWQGKRFKTQDYKDYEEELFYVLPNKSEFKNTLAKIDKKVKNDKITKLIVFLEFGFSNKASDIDNPVKPFLDILQKKYEFNDKDVFKLSLEKKLVKKGEEYVAFTISNILV